MTRLAAFATYHDANNLGIFGDLIRTLEVSAQHDVFSDEVRTHARTLPSARVMCVARSVAGRVDGDA